jgi:hypothetical protein
MTTTFSKKKSPRFLEGFVGVPGFEPGTPWSQTRCATGLRYTPNLSLLILTRTYAIQNSILQAVIRQGLEPRTCCLEGSCSIQLSYRTIQLFVVTVYAFLHCRNVLLKTAERGGFEPPVRFKAYDSLANCWFKPLTHLSSGLKSSFSSNWSEKGSANIEVGLKLSQCCKKLVSEKVRLIG